MISDKERTKKLMTNIPYNYVTRPKVLCNSSTKVKKILRSGNVEKVEKLIRDGYGYKLIGETTSIPKIKALLKAVPFYMARIDMLHEAVVKGQLRDVQVLLNTTSTAYSVLKPKPENLVISKDSAGIGLLHKAVFYDYPQIVEWLAKNYPNSVHIRDKLGRIPLHYVNSTSEPDKIWELLVSLGSDINAEDVQGKTPLYFLSNDTQIQLPDKPQHAYKPYGSEANMIKSSNIRIWIHDQDISKLQQVIWEGHGDKLKTETSNKPLMKKFLTGVPHIMSVIQEIHKAVITNEINKLMLNSRNPIPTVILSSKDTKGVTPLHKAAGLGHEEIIEYILSKYPEAIHIGDNDGRTALHYAASFKKNEIYNQLSKFGANENIIDKFGRTAKCYQSRQGDIDAELLYEIPSAPRTGVANGYPSSWDWGILNASLSNTDKIMNNFNEKVFSAGRYATEEKNIKIPNNIQITNHTKKLETNSYDSSNIENENAPDLEEKNLHQDKDENHNEDVIKSTNLPNDQETEPHIFPAKAPTPDPEYDDIENKSIEDPVITILHNEFDKVLDNYDSTPDEDFMDEIKLKNNINMDNKITKIIDEGNIEKIGNFILDGFGEFLIDRKSQDSEIQDFINNLPIYLKKIELIHHCCEIGNLEELQKYLDRRKLAVARENKTGLYLSPLHIAVINNHRNVARYLGGRFPETFKVVDKLGRTPLHFASIHPNGRYIYNMLLTLGADKNIEDHNGKTPEYYYLNSNDRRFHQLLRVLDRFKNHSKDYNFNEIAIGETEEFYESENKYTSAGLGKAIRTGLSAIASEKPSKPIKFLANYLNNYEEQPTSNKPESPRETTPVKKYYVDEQEEREDLHFQEPNNNKFPNNDLLVEEAVEDEQNEEIIFNENPEFESNHNDEHDDEFSDDEKETSQNRRNSIINYNQEFSNQFQQISRDKHGQTVVHFAAARTPSRNALLQTLQELDVNIAYRDELYRTARDIAVFSELYDNVKAIDAYVVHLAANGQTDKILQLLMDGYDHILELESQENIIEVVKARNHEKTLHILQTITLFEEIRDDLHAAIRKGNKVRMREIFNKCGRDAKLMAICKNDTSRCSLHISVLSQHKDIVKYIVKKYPETLKTGDNLERTALHYAMGLKTVEELSHILIKAGAERVVKDLKGRQPSYYFMNNSDVLQMQQEEMFLSDQLSRKNTIKNRR